MSTVFLDFDWGQHYDKVRAKYPELTLRRIEEDLC